MLLSRLKTAGVNELLAVTHGAVGDYTDGTGANDLPVLNMVAHALLGGLASEAVGGSFAAGAASGLASSIAANLGLFEGMSANQIAKVSQIIGGAAALLAGGNGVDVNQGAATAQSAALNNYLTHAEIKEYQTRLDACKNDKGCEARLFVLFREISIANSAAASMAVTCSPEFHPADS